MKNHLQQLQSALREAVEGMSEEQFRCHPEGKWCATEILEHLLRSYRSTAKGLEKCLAERAPLLTPSTWRAQLAKTLVMLSGRMPGGRKAPERVLPKGLPREQVLEELWPAILRMDALLSDCEAYFGRRTKFMSHPVLGPLTAAQWRKFHWVHGRHHIRQIGERRRLTR